MPPGRYYIGDLCYVLDSPEPGTWKQVCDIIISGNEVLNGEFNLPDGRRFARYSTMYGDGSFLSNQGTEHPVDSGGIGCILMSDIKTPEEEVKKFGAVFDFHTEFKTDVDGGMIMFGGVSIDTDPDYEEDDWEEEEDWDDDDEF